MAAVDEKKGGAISGAPLGRFQVFVLYKYNSRVLYYIKVIHILVNKE